MTQVNCPRCNGISEWSPDNPYRPFCSQRCKMSDLDGWLTNEYAIPAANDLDEEFPESDG